MKKERSRTRKSAAKTVYTALSILKENGSEMPFAHIKEEVKKRCNFTDWELEKYETTGYIRWESLLSFFSIDITKAGFIIKKKGKWFLTPEGEDALKLGEHDLLDRATELYYVWEQANKKEDIRDESEQEIEEAVSTEAYELNELESISIEQIKNYIGKKGAYEFQDLVAALLRAMGYYTPFIAPRGKDGGIDVIAYRDPLGTMEPRIKVQVKHRQNTASVSEIRQLNGILRNGDIGIFVSSGGFTPDAKKEAINTNSHLELIDIDKFISLWKDFYDKMPDVDKVLLPLQPVFFLAE